MHNAQKEMSSETVWTVKCKSILDNLVFSGIYCTQPNEYIRILITLSYTFNFTTTNVFVERRFPPICPVDMTKLETSKEEPKR